MGGKRRLHLAVLSTYDVLMARLPTWRWLVTRLLLILAVGCDALAAFSFVAAPNFMQPMFTRGGPADWVVGMNVTAVLVMVGATRRMFRISRRNPEAGPSDWRYRTYD